MDNTPPPRLDLWDPPVKTHQNRLIQTLFRSEYLSDPQNFNLYYTVLLIITINYKE